MNFLMYTLLLFHIASKCTLFVHAKDYFVLRAQVKHIEVQCYEVEHVIFWQENMRRTKKADTW